MTTLDAQVAAAEARSDKAAPRRANNLDLLKKNLPFKADTPERVRLWFRRRGLPEQMAEHAIQTGNVPLPVQEQMKRVGQDQPVGLERVLGSTDFLGIAFLERGLQVARTVGRVAIRGRLGQAAGYGTGFMISPRLMMTNNHVLADADQAAASVIEFDYYARADGVPETIKVFTLEPELFFRTDPTLDYTIVAVAERGTNQLPLSVIGWNQLMPEEGKAVIGQWVNIIQHPNGEPKQLVLRNNEIVDTPEEFLTYMADTAPGSSGSPVYNDRWELVALHHAGVPARDGQGRVLNVNKTLWEKWMGEQNIKWLSNEGARVSRIVAHVRNSGFSSAEQALFEASLQPSAVAETIRPPEARMADGKGIEAVVGDDETVTWTIPLKISMSLAGIAAEQRGKVAGGSGLPQGLQAPLPSQAV